MDGADDAAAVPNVDGVDDDNGGGRHSIHMSLPIASGVTRCDPTRQQGPVYTSTSTSTSALLVGIVYVPAHQRTYINTCMYLYIVSSPPPYSPHRVLPMCRNETALGYLS